MAESEARNNDLQTGVTIARAVHIASSYIARNHVSVADLSVLIRSLFVALTELKGAARSTDPQKPAIAIKKSFSDDHIICLEDGKRLTMLKRYLRTHHDMSPEQYRAKWNLPHDYPMVAPAYARLRSTFAKRIGLGTKPASTGRRRPRK